MLTAALKLVDIVARSFFLLIVLYGLPVRASGQFGIGLTLIGLFAFATGYERYLDLQRQMIGCSEATIDALVRATVRFFALGYAVWMTPLVVALFLLGHATVLQVALWAVIAVGEHLASESYRLALISTRHRSILWLGVTKNLLLLAGVSLIHLSGRALDLDLVLLGWAGLGLVTGVVGVAWMLRPGVRAEDRVVVEHMGWRDQLVRSRTHFVIGLVALGSLQIDRLVAAGFLSLEDSGVYFRHVFLAVSAYQAAGILSHNRITKGLYDYLRAEKTRRAQRLVDREKLRFVLLTLVLVATVVLVEVLHGQLPKALQFLDTPLLVWMLLVYLLRGVADYNAMVLNARRQERRVLRAQSCAVLAALIVGGVLVQIWAATGLALGALSGAATYLLLTQLAARDAIAAAGRSS